ncbi:hypothetical protein GIB67_025935 [Kingdonia uniflora]|uniref:Uncharacterized protein n=1 Tax=Kingdonia uniflora TaxID=39325 RepID=A0A7J7P023_9MAGN|nr:hypothetical protein GIB67_025935 [Kingdonia uniflora]
MSPIPVTENDGLSTIQASIVALFVFMLFLLKMSIPKKITERLPPGPYKLPIIGNMNHLVGKAPHRLIIDLASKYGPVFHLKLGSISTIVVSSPELAREILKTNDVTFANWPKLVAAKTLYYNYTDMAFAPYGAYWRQLRKICIHEFLAPKREAVEEASKLSEGFHIGDFFPSLDFVSAITGMRLRIGKNFLDIDCMLTQILEDHVEKSKDEEPETDDLVDVLLRLQKDDKLEGPLTNDNLKGIILGKLRTRRISLEWAMLELIEIQMHKRRSGGP